MRSWTLCLAIITTALCAGEPAKAPAASPDDKPLQAAAVLQDAPGLYGAQLLGDLDRPVGEAIKLQKLSMAARVNAKGQLELDEKADGRFRQIDKQELITVSLKDGSKSQSIKLRIHKREDGTWVYRNITQLLLQIGNEQFPVIDANANGAYNEPGVDGITWQGEGYAFPLPAAEERWCSATCDFAGLQMGPWGEQAAVKGRPLTTTVAAALPVLKGTNEERVKLGLTPRPEDLKLSSDLQKHCAYMVANGTLQHEETKGKPGYTPEGAASGPRSILSMGTPAEAVAFRMVQTYFHRQDVVRPGTLAFGVGYEGRYGGIDGRTNMAKASPNWWPVLCPVPGQKGLPVSYAKEAPDATPGDNDAGYPITAYFGTNKLKLVAHTLKVAGPAQPGGPGPLPVAAPPGPAAGESAECYEYDPKTGANANFTGFQHCVCIIAKDPLKPSTEYEVMLNVDVDGKPWTKTWRFSTGAAAGRPTRRR